MCIQKKKSFRAMTLGDFGLVLTALPLLSSIGSYPFSTFLSHREGLLTLAKDAISLHDHTPDFTNLASNHLTF